MTQAAAQDSLAARCRPAGEAVRRMPGGLVPAAAVVAAIVIQAWPAAQAALEFDRAAVAAGQVWRLLTGQLVHFGWAHLAADLACFVALCTVSSHLGPGTGRAVVLSAGAVGAAVLLLAGDITAYRGLSGIDYGVLAWVLTVRALRAPGAAGRLWFAILLAVGAKVAVEAVTGTNLLPTSLPGGVAVVGITHAAGILAGIALAAWSSGLRRAANQGQSPCLGLGTVTNGPKIRLFSPKGWHSSAQGEPTPPKQPLRLRRPEALGNGHGGGRAL